MNDIEKALEFFEGCKHDCGNPEFINLALTALREQAEPERGCGWCKSEYTIIDDDFGQPVHPKMIKFCWSCGKRLEVKND